MSRTLVPNVTSGGIAMPIGRNMYYMRGKKHKDGGIIIGNKTNGLEVEDGEVVKLDNDGTKVYSSMPLLNGNSPAQLVLNGFQPNKVFNAQEKYKDNVGLKDDGTTKYAGGGSHPYGRVSENGINIIRSFEGYMPRVYRDSGGVETIGYGETDKNFINKYRATGISRQDADAQLRNRAQWFYDGVARRTKGWDKLNQQQRDALTSYAYNIGLGGYGAHKHLLSAIERGDYENAALNINAGFNDARNPGLKKRRIKERNLFIQGAVGIKSNIKPTEPPVVSNPEFDKLVTPNNPLVDKFMKIKTLYDMTNNLPKFKAGGVHRNVPLGWQMSSDGKYIQTTYGNGSIKRIQLRPGQTPQQAINEYGNKQNKEYDAKVDNESFGKKVLNFVVDGLGFDSRGDDVGFHLDPNGKGGYKVRNVHMNHAPIEETIVANKVLGKPIELIGNHLVKPALKWIGKRAVRGAIKGTNEEILRYVPRRFRPKIANFADDAAVDSKLGVEEARSVGAKGKRGRTNKGTRSKVKNKTTTSNSSSTNNSTNNVVDSGTTTNNASGNSTINTTTTNSAQTVSGNTGNTKGSIRRIIDTIKGKVNRKTLNDVVGKVGKPVKYAKDYVTDKVRQVNKNAAVSDFMKNSSNNDYSYKNISRFVEKFNEGSRVKISEDDFINELYSRLDRNNGNVYRNLTRTRGANAGSNSIERTTGTTTETATSTESSSATNTSEGTTTSTTNSTATGAATSTTEGETTATAGTATGNDGRGKFRAILDHVKNNKIKYGLGAITTGVGVYNMNRNPDRTPHETNYVEQVTPTKPAQNTQPVNPNNNVNADTTRVDSTNTQTPQTTETTETPDNQNDNQNANKVVIRNPNVSVTKEQPAKPSTTNNTASTPAARTNTTNSGNTNHNTSATQPTQGNTSVTHTNGNSNTTAPAPQNTPAGTSTTTPKSNGTSVSTPPSTGKLQTPSGVGTTPTSTNVDVVQFNRASGNSSLFGNTGPIRVSGGTYTVGQRKGHYDSNGNPVFDTQNVNIDGKDYEAFVPYTKGSGDNKTIIPSKKFTMNYDSYRLPTINELRGAEDKTLGASKAVNDVLMQNYLKENLYNGKTKDVYGKTIDANYKPETPSSSGKISLWDRFKALDDGTKSDIIGIGANSLASVAGFINNAAMLNGLQEPIAPAPAYAAKLKTTVNVAPQLNTVDSGVNRMISDTNDNTASSNVAASRNIAARLTGMANKNQIYGNKENAETELINKDKLNQQEVHNANALQYNQYLNNLVAFRNNVADKRSENINGLINGLNSGVQDFLTKREQRTNFRNTIKASLVSNPDAALLMGNAFKGLLPESFMQTLYNRQAEAEEMKRKELQRRLNAMDAIKGAADKLNVQ